jgi:hypothetical protein
MGMGQKQYRTSNRMPGHENSLGIAGDLAFLSMIPHYATVFIIQKCCGSTPSWLSLDWSWFLSHLSYGLPWKLLQLLHILPILLLWGMICDLFPWHSFHHL